MSNSVNFYDFIGFITYNIEVHELVCVYSLHSPDLHWVYHYSVCLLDRTFLCVCLVWRFFVSCLFYCSYFMPNCGACVHVANNDGERDYFDGRDNYSESTDDFLLRQPWCCP